MRLLRYAAEEAIGHLRGPWFLAVVGTAALIAAVATDISVRDFRLRLAQNARQDDQRRLDSKKNSGFITGRSSEPALRALRPPTPLSVLVRGIETTLPTTFDFGPAGVVSGPIDASLTQDSEVGTLLDVEAVSRLFLGLLAIVIGVESVAADRATGVLTALLSQPVHSGIVAMAKYLSILIAASVASALALVVAVSTVRLETADLISVNFWESVLALQATTMLYLGVLGASGMIVGSLVQTPARSLLVGLVVWVATALVIPQVIVFGARILAPTPDPSLIAAQRQSIFASRSLSTENALGDVYREAAGPGPLSHTLEQRPMVLAAIDHLWTSESRETRQILSAIDERAHLATDRQDHLVARLSLLNPGALFSQAEDALAGTGRAAAIAWFVAVDRYQASMAAELFDYPPRILIAVPVNPGREIMTIDRRPFPHAADVVPMKVPLLSFSDRLRSARGSLVALAVYFVVSFAGVLATFPKLTL